jgi:hypothetical protein
MPSMQTMVPPRVRGTKSAEPCVRGLQGAEKTDATSREGLSGCSCSAVKREDTTTARTMKGSALKYALRGVLQVR